MSETRQNLYLACLFLHFTLIGAVCVHETLWLLKKDVVTVPFGRRAVWETLDKVPTAILGEGSNSRNLWKQALATYTNAAGIEAGYGYFAPNIPGTNALVFECRYPDGRVDYQIPTVRGAAAQLRLTTLIEQIGRTDFDQWRIGLIKLLAQSTWRRHPDAVSMRAFFGTVTPPTPDNYRAGKPERTFNCLYVYDFRREAPQGKRLTP